ncbi:MAG TPA: hypothetical protein VJ204_17235 [Solirubrobacterales bacterium]|nr:hypothetical protein [Solirubrobacterales bacterium]
MRRRSVVLALGCVVAGFSMVTGSASAATVVGSNCPAKTTAAAVSVVSLKNPAGYPLPSAIPSAGVITSWTFTVGGIVPPEFQVTEKLKVFAPTETPGQLKVVGESPATISSSSTTSAVRIPVQSGDLLGSSLSLLNNGKLEQGAFYCDTENPGDEIATVSGDPITGSTVSTLSTEAGLQNPIVVSVEPDADGDGYGDETQDQCPTDASTHGPCPAPKDAPAPPAPTAPTAPISLSASAAAKKAFLTVSLTTTAQASVTVTGTATIGKGKTVKLSGNTQTVALGALAKFTVLFPAKLKAALKQLPTSKKLTIDLSASAPGATTKTLTVRVPGQMKPEKKRHVR